MLIKVVDTEWRGLKLKILLWWIVWPRWQWRVLRETYFAIAIKLLRWNWALGIWKYISLIIRNECKIWIVNERVQVVRWKSKGDFEHGLVTSFNFQLKIDFASFYTKHQKQSFFIVLLVMDPVPRCYSDEPQLCIYLEYWNIGTKRWKYTERGNGISVIKGVAPNNLL